MLDDSAAVRRALALLHQWGWETGLKRLQAEMEAAPDEEQRQALVHFVGWMALERSEYDEALRQFDELAGNPALAGWALVGQACVKFWQVDYTAAHELLNLAAEAADARDAVLHGTIAHIRGTVCFHQGDDEAALPLLHEALERFGLDHFGTGRVLDTLGMFYAKQDNYPAAREFYEQALACKRRHADLAGEALTFGQLGRLHLDWGSLDEAERRFGEDLELSRRFENRQAVAQMHGELGRVALARHDWRAAAGWLDECLRLGDDAQWPKLAGYARKDRALAALGEGHIELAERLIGEAQSLFKKLDFAEGLAHVSFVWGQVRRAQGRLDESEHALQAALRFFDMVGELGNTARARLEIARTRLARDAVAVARHELELALAAAETCRRAALVEETERALRELDEVALWRHVFGRVRGRRVEGPTTSLADGKFETVTTLFFDLKGSTEFTRRTDPRVVMESLNQMTAETAVVLKGHGIQANQYLGDGFMAVVRGEDHAVRSVQAALELLQALTRFNRPRHVLKLHVFEARIGIATGDVCLGNVGTYEKMDYTAVGVSVNLAARLQKEARTDSPCVSQETRERLGDEFAFREGSPRPVDAAGIGKCQAWDVQGRK